MKSLFIWSYVGGIVWLAGWELAALIVNDRYTISELTWDWEGGGWSAGRYLVLAALTWLTLHLALGWLR